MGGRAYLAFHGRSMPLNKYDLEPNEETKTIRIHPECSVQRDDPHLDVVFTSFDPTGKHEMMRSFLGQTIRFTIEVED